MATTGKKPKIAYKVFPPEKSGLEVQTYLVSACDNLVLREKNKKTVIGQVVDDEFVMLNDDIISTAEKYGFKPDETMLAEREEGDEEVEIEEEGDEEVEIEEEGDEEVEIEEEGDEEVEIEEEGDEEVEIDDEGDEEVGEEVDEEEIKKEVVEEVDKEEIKKEVVVEEVDKEEIKKEVVVEEVVEEVDELNKVNVVVEESVDRETGSEHTCKASQDFQENMLGLEGNLSSMIKTLNSLATETCKTLDVRDKTIASLEDQSSKKDSVIEELRQELAKTKEDLTTAKKKLDGLKQLLS